MVLAYGIWYYRYPGEYGSVKDGYEMLYRDHIVVLQISLYRIHVVSITTT